MPDSLKATAKTGLKRRWQRRWANICKDCGCPLIFLDRVTPQSDGRKASPWVPTEIYGTKNGELAPWQGEIAFDPRIHVEHRDCIGRKRRLARFLTRIQDDI